MADNNERVKLQSHKWEPVLRCVYCGFEVKWFQPEGHCLPAERSPESADARTPQLTKSCPHCGCETHMGPCQNDSCTAPQSRTPVPAKEPNLRICSRDAKRHGWLAGISCSACGHNKGRHAFSLDDVVFCFECTRAAVNERCAECDHADPHTAPMIGAGYVGCQHAHCDCEQDTRASVPAVKEGCRCWCHEQHMKYRGEDSVVYADTPHVRDCCAFPPADNPDNPFAEPELRKLWDVFCGPDTVALDEEPACNVATLRRVLRKVATKEAL